MKKQDKLLQLTSQFLQDSNIPLPTRISYASEIQKIYQPSPRREKRARWIQINESRVYEDYRMDNSPVSVLKPYSDLVARTAQRAALAAQRPVIRGHKRHRLMKDKAYQEILKILQEHGITGEYIGLAAGYTPELYTLFAGHTKRFTNCQNSPSDYADLLPYQDAIQKAYPDAEFSLEPSDILNVLSTEKQKYSILDLDFMWTLTEERIDNIVQAVRSGAKLPATVAIWHLAGRAVKTSDVEKHLRPYLFQEMSKYFSVKDYTKIEYYEGSPMRCDVYTIGSKYARRDRAA